MKNKKISKYMTNSVISILLILCSFWFVFALISGAEPGFKGILLNSLNALPWLILFAFVYGAWKRPFAGGIILIILGIFAIFFFNALSSLVVLFGICLPLIILGGLLILTKFLNKNNI